MNYSFVLFVIFVFSAKQIYSQNTKLDAFKELKNILTGYDKDIKPDLGENKSTEIGITLYIMDLNFNENEKKLFTDMYFRQSWTDPRLVFASEDAVNGGQSLVDKIWTPDTFTSSETVKIVKYPSPNLFIRIQPNGTVFFSERLQQNTRCLKRDEDVFVCTIKFESYGFSAENIKYSMAKGILNSAEITKELDQTDKQYKLVNHTVEEVVETLSQGDYSAIRMQLLFDKRPMEVPVPLEIVTLDGPVVTTQEPVNFDSVLNESKKIGKLFSGFKFN